MQGMRNASVLPLPVFAAARTSLRAHKEPVSQTTRRSPQNSATSTGGTHLPSSRGRMLLCWISVMCSKPISFTPFSVFSLTSEAREAKDVSSNAPGMPGMERLATVSGRLTRACSRSCRKSRRWRLPRDHNKCFCLPLLTPVS